MRRALVVLPLLAASCAAVTGLGDYAIDRTVDAGVDAPEVDPPDAAVDAMPSDSAPPVCGDGTRAVGESCDDGNVLPFDGCSATCTIEPRCTDGACVAVCGDGFVSAPEACDDGNVSDGDGCSATCTVERGFTCSDVPLPTAAPWTAPILYRDMRYGTTAEGHPDFQNGGTPAVQKTLVTARLDTTAPYGKPVFARAGSSLSTEASFCWWYHDTGCTDAGVNPFARTVAATLTLAPVRADGGIDGFVFQANPFAPIDGLGWNATDAGQVAGPPECPAAHNYSFTSELHAPFRYRGGEAIEFSGDDDAWIFVNGRLVIDLGGLHVRATGAVVLSDVPNNRCEEGVCQTIAMAGLGLVAGGVYDLAVFHAERRYCGSSYAVAFAAFERTTTRCVRNR